MIKKKTLLKILFGFNILALVGLLLSYLSLFVSPENSWMFAFMGLIYPIHLLINVGFVLLWLFVRPVFALFSALTIIIGISKINDLYQWEGAPEENVIQAFSDEDSTIHLLSWNVRLFDLYNWSKNKQTRNKMIDVIQNEKADILCFQEFYYDDSGKFNTLDTLLDIQWANRVHIENSSSVNTSNHFGIATFSKFPIINRGVIPFKDVTDNISIFTDILAFKDTIRIYNLHLESIRFRREDYSILEKLTGNKDKTDLDGPQKILDRMRRAYIRRARQTDIIKDHISRSPYPVLVCGDFNDTPNSYTYHNISYGLEDAFKNAGYGMGATFVSIIPFLRIDFILYSPETFSPIYFRVLKRSLSDHYPIVSVMRLNSFN